MTGVNKLYYQKKTLRLNNEKKSQNDANHKSLSVIIDGVFKGETRFTIWNSNSNRRNLKKLNYAMKEAKNLKK